MNPNKGMEKWMDTVIVTAGSSYLDIDAYACCVAMTELLQRQGINAIAYSTAPCNYSVSQSLVVEDRVVQNLPVGLSHQRAGYIIVDVSDPCYIEGVVPLDRVVKVYDHHAGFENYWKREVGEGACIEHIGAAATLIFREWKKAGLERNMSHCVARLLVAAILDNTLNLTARNTTDEDVAAFHELCDIAGVDREWCDSYFADVQCYVEADLQKALFNDIKVVKDQAVFPPYIAQLCVWDAQRTLARLTEIRQWFAVYADRWMLNIVDIKRCCSYFVCDHPDYQMKIEQVFDICFEENVAELPVAYLRKEMLKKVAQQQSKWRKDTW